MMSLPSTFNSLSVELNYTMSGIIRLALIHIRIARYHDQDPD
jgi:hypothetical protein